MKPEPFFGVLSDVLLGQCGELLGGLLDVGALVFCFRRVDGRGDDEGVPARLVVAMHEGGEDGNGAESPHAGGAGEVVRRLAEEFDEDAVADGRILVHDEADHPVLRHHIEHLAHASLVSDVHADERALLDDEFVRALSALLFGDADERDARLRERAAHELPVTAMRRRDDAAFSLFERGLQVFEAFDGDVVRDMFLDNGKAQDFHEHRAEAHGRGFCDAPCFFIGNVQARLDLVHGEELAPLRHDGPREAADAPAEAIREAARQQAGDSAQAFQEVVGKHPAASLFLIFLVFIDELREALDFLAELGQVLHGRLHAEPFRMALDGESCAELAFGHVADDA